MKTIAIFFVFGRLGWVAIDYEPLDRDVAMQAAATPCECPTMPQGSPTVGDTVYVNSLVQGSVFCAKLTQIDRP